MRTDKLILLGKIIKTHGFNGAVVIALEEDVSEKVKEMESVFVEIDGKAVPFFFAEVSAPSPATLIASFDYYETKDRINEFIGCRVFSDLDPSVLKRDSDLPVSYIGYEVQDKDGKVIGKISKVLSYPMQVLFQLDAGKSEPVLIPFNPDWIVREDHSKYLLILNLPEGLETINN
ncbi:MAG: ribosome maturation factor RimM [Marinilabiliaceae bacterium]|nr:ribosome maturation factor RimM [Marinilabiliaceae bacterium]